MLKVEILLSSIGILIKEQTFGKMAQRTDVNGPFFLLHTQKCWLKQNKNALYILTHFIQT